MGSIGIKFHDYEDLESNYYVLYWNKNKFDDTYPKIPIQNITLK